MLGGFGTRLVGTRDGMVVHGGTVEVEITAPRMSGGSGALGMRTVSVAMSAEGEEGEAASTAVTISGGTGSLGRRTASVMGTVARLQRLLSATGGGVALGAGTIAPTFVELGMSGGARGAEDEMRAR